LQLQTIALLRSEDENIFTLRVKNIRIFGADGADRDDVTLVATAIQLYEIEYCVLYPCEIIGTWMP
jgi:hypothetical protein